VKPLPLLLALALGLVIGLLIGRLPSDPADETVAAPTSVANTPGPAPRAADPVIEFRTSNTGSTTAPAVPAAIPSPAPVQVASPPAPDGISNPIDAGPVFNQQFATAEKQGVSDGMLEAHRALEREARDDSWSYPLEAEIENSLIPDTSMGNFRREHLECRSTMCEIRLSAEGGAQIEALRQWTSDIQKFPWASRMVLSSSSTVSTDDRMDSLLIVTKPPEAN